jgi:hypothetical protein
MRTLLKHCDLVSKLIIMFLHLAHLGVSSRQVHPLLCQLLIQTLAFSLQVVLRHSLLFQILAQFLDLFTLTADLLH